MNGLGKPVCILGGVEHQNRPVSSGSHYMVVPRSIDGNQSSLNERMNLFVKLGHGMHIQALF